jgi:hypothetical protein
VDDCFLTRLATLLTDHHSIIARLSLLDDRGTALMVRALANRYACSSRADTHADASIFSTGNGGRQGETSRSQNQSLSRRSVPQLLPDEDNKNIRMPFPLVPDL